MNNIELLKVDLILFKDKVAICEVEINKLKSKQNDYLQRISVIDQLLLNGDPVIYKDV